MYKIRVSNLYCHIDIDLAKPVGTITIYTILHLGTVTIFGVTSSNLARFDGLQVQATHEYLCYLKGQVTSIIYEPLS